MKVRKSVNINVKPNVSVVVGVVNIREIDYIGACKGYRVDSDGSLIRSYD